ncbi:MAG TPA: response regulator [Acidobacteriota bacterium]|nr:response regulator [Acidobacteriota bacterium]
MTSGRVLLVDDDHQIRSSLKMLLDSAGLEVDTCGTLEDAFTYLDKTPYRVVISDVQLTGKRMNEGLQVLQYVKDHTVNTACILMSGGASSELRVQLIESGAAFYFDKPVRASTLLEALNSLGCDLK